MPAPRNYVDIEVRALLTEGQYEGLKARLICEASLMGQEWEETHYFEGPHDLRIQKSESRARVWLKKAGTPGAAFEEVQVHVAPQQFHDLGKLFAALGYAVGIVWHRNRMRFAWEDVAVSLDYTKGYGHVVELRKTVHESMKEYGMAALREKMDILGLRPTPKPVLHDRFTWYRMKWRELLAAEYEKEAAEKQKTLP